MPNRHAHIVSSRPDDAQFFDTLLDPMAGGPWG
jgi:hypothetical protein